MKKNNTWRFFVVALPILLLASFTFAQKQMSQGKGMPLYNPETEVKVMGIVEEVKQVTGPRGWGGTHLSLKTEAEVLDVHIGPSSFLKKQGFTFAKGDQVEVMGSKIKYGDADALIAREIKKGGRVLTLRNAQGIPVWSRQNRP
jgi:hypothetical protein